MLSQGKGASIEHMNISDENLYPTLVGEALAFGLLARALCADIDRAWIQSLKDNNVFEDIPFGYSQPDSKKGLSDLASWNKKNPGAITDRAYDELRADYTRLFVFPGEQFSPPWESVYFNADQLMFQEQTVQVRSCYRRFGLEPEKINNEPDDHIALELSFIAYLASRALNAIETRNNRRFRQVIDAQRLFLCEHLLRWVPPWCNRVASVARTDFYKGIALLAKGSLCELSTVLGL